MRWTESKSGTYSSFVLLFCLFCFRALCIAYPHWHAYHLLPERVFSFRVSHTHHLLYSLAWCRKVPLSLCDARHIVASAACVHVVNKHTHTYTYSRVSSLSIRLSLLFFFPQLPCLSVEFVSLSLSSCLFLSLAASNGQAWRQPSAGDRCLWQPAVSAV